jgi:hypothetical protein
VAEEFPFRRSDSRSQINLAGHEIRQDGTKTIATVAAFQRLASHRQGDELEHPFPQIGPLLKRGKYLAELIGPNV